MLAGSDRSVSPSSAQDAKGSLKARGRLGDEAEAGGRPAEVDSGACFHALAIVRCTRHASLLNLSVLKHQRRADVSARLRLSGVCFGFRSGISVRRGKALLLLRPTTPMSFCVAIGLRLWQSRLQRKKSPISSSMMNFITTMVRRSGATSSKPC